jgi:UDP-2,3-diacylglucosamine hydrolase
MKGNRDVLAGDAFAARCGAALIADPTLVDLYGTRTLLMHGDTLCTDDVEYQKFRVTARNPAFQQRFLSQPIAERKKQMLDMRMKSEQHKQGQAAEIMDVAPATVEKVLREFDYPRLIHGHTHRPARHLHTVDGRHCERWVLNDWYQRGGFLRCNAGGCKAELL